MRGGVMLLVAPPVFRAPRGLLGPGCWLCPWAAARPRAVRAASFARRVASKPGQAPPPPTGTAARPSGPSGALHTSGACCAEDDSPRLEARPGPAAADQHRALALPPPAGRCKQALRSLRRPPHRRHLWFWCARPGSIAHGHRNKALRSLRRPTGSDGGLAALGAGCRRVVGVSRF